MSNYESEDQRGKEVLIKYWMEKARESLESAISEHQNGRFSPAVRSTYYACFYALSAVLWNKGKIFRKHSAVRGSLHRDLIKAGILDDTWGRFYDVVFDSRQRGDYQPMVTFEKEQVGNYIDKARGFVEQMEGILNKVK